MTTDQKLGWLTLALLGGIGVGLWVRSSNRRIAVKFKDAILRDVADYLCDRFGKPSEDIYSALRQAIDGEQPAHLIATVVRIEARLTKQSPTKIGTTIAVLLEGEGKGWITKISRENSWDEIPSDVRERIHPKSERRTDVLCLFTRHRRQFMTTLGKKIQQSESIVNWKKKQPEQSPVEDVKAPIDNNRAVTPEPVTTMESFAPREPTTGSTRLSFARRRAAGVRGVEESHRQSQATLRRLGALMRSIPKGKHTAFNIYGPPGTGKTMCVEALARELGKLPRFRLMDRI